MRVLIGCEFSGITRQAFAAYGHDVWSCDLVESEQEGNHLVGDIRYYLNEKWDLIVASPPANDVEICKAIWEAPCNHIAIDNPPGKVEHALGKPAQVLNPWMFGVGHIRVSALWLKNLPLLQPEVTNRLVIRPHKKSFNRDWREELRMSPVVAREMAKAWQSLPLN